ncbi:MAG: hypothetical protein HOP10_00505 [Chitinophagaceae bacterium]|nr:hypothetical protein [Chitinophagaceae bacterium]
MDYHVFERTRFKINDEIILSQQEKDYIDSLGLSFDTINVVCTMEPQQSSGRSNLWMLTTWCDNVYTCVQIQMAGFRSNSSQLVSDCPSGTWLVSELCTDTWVYIPSSGDGPGGGGGNPGGPGGGGGSSPPPPPCNNGPSRTNLIDPCVPGWEPAPTLTLTQQLQAWDNAIIIDQSVRQCIKDIINHIKSIEAGAIADMIRTLSGEIPGFNWTIKEVLTTTPANADAVTSIGQNGNRDAITELNQTVLANATNISMARTIIHEAIHAFIYDFVYNSASLTAAEKAQIMALPFSQKLKKYFKLIFQNATNSEHNAMVEDFHDDIRDMLKLLCPLLGINLTGTDLNLFCSDMAWGGLQDLDSNSPWNDPNILTGEDRERITKRLDIELNNLPGFTGYVNGYYINLTRQGTKACP